MSAGNRPTCTSTYNLANIKNAQMWLFNSIIKVNEGVSVKTIISCTAPIIISGSKIMLTWNVDQ